MSEITLKGTYAKEASVRLALCDTATKNKALAAIADALILHTETILNANAIDLDNATQKGIKGAMFDRLLLNKKRIQEMAEGLKEIILLPDPIGESIASFDRPNGLHIEQVRVPLGVIGIIYEARPNVTIDAAGLCLKAGNAVILRGGREALTTNKALIKVVEQSLSAIGFTPHAIQLIENPDRSVAAEMMRANAYFDVLIPRGGAGLIKAVVETATVPVIETGVGNCHVYVEKSADLKMAVDILVNAKTNRPGVCNAAESLLVDQSIADEFLPLAYRALHEKKVELRGCERTRKILPQIKAADEDDWGEEYLDLILSVKVVDDIDEAIMHIRKYGTKHSETIVTRDSEAGEKFLNEVDAAAVYVNASTRFTDGFEFGFGAEIGISTQKLHARGPMGLKELTSTKYKIHGNGQIR
ncbi:MAG: glutamate-5-semialdehyde dehydrogenase [Erysipelotrichaceae bacterium]